MADEELSYSQECLFHGTLLRPINGFRFRRDVAGGIRQGIWHATVYSNASVRARVREEKSDGLSEAPISAFDGRVEQLSC